MIDLQSLRGQLAVLGQIDPDQGQRAARQVERFMQAATRAAGRFAKVRPAISLGPAALLLGPPIYRVPHHRPDRGEE